jgi:hypothetical protein
MDWLRIKRKSRNTIWSLKKKCEWIVIWSRCRCLTKALNISNSEPWDGPILQGAYFMSLAVRSSSKQTFELCNGVVCKTLLRNAFVILFWSVFITIMFCYLGQTAFFKITTAITELIDRCLFLEMSSFKISDRAESRDIKVPRRCRGQPWLGYNPEISSPWKSKISYIWLCWRQELWRQQRIVATISWVNDTWQGIFCWSAWRMLCFMLGPTRGFIARVIPNALGYNWATLFLGESQKLRQ